MRNRGFAGVRKYSIFTVLSVLLYSQFRSIIVATPVFLKKRLTPVHLPEEGHRTPPRLLYLHCSVSQNRVYLWVYGQTSAMEGKWNDVWGFHQGSAYHQQLFLSRLQGIKAQFSSAASAQVANSVGPVLENASDVSAKASEMLAMRPSKALRVDECCVFWSDFKFDHMAVWPPKHSILNIPGLYIYICIGGIW